MQHINESRAVATAPALGVDISLDRNDIDNSHSRQNDQAPAKSRGRRTGFSLTVARADGSEISLSGRPAWMLHRLMRSPGGITTAELPPGVRVSHFVWKLRTAYGVGVVTETQAHCGDFPGWHAVYRLSEPLRLIRAEGAAP